MKILIVPSNFLLGTIKIDFLFKLPIVSDFKLAKITISGNDNIVEEFSP